MRGRLIHVALTLVAALSAMFAGVSAAAATGELLAGETIDALRYVAQALGGAFLTGLCEALDESDDANTSVKRFLGILAVGFVFGLMFGGLIGGLIAVKFEGGRVYGSAVAGLTGWLASRYGPALAMSFAKGRINRAAKGLADATNGSGPPDGP